MRFILSMAICFLYFGFFSQKLPYKGENNEVIITIDSLICKDVFGLSNFYVDSTNNLPYTGLVTMKHRQFLDSFLVYNGFSDGLSKEYLLQNNLYILNRKYFYNQDKKYYFKQSFLQKTGVIKYYDKKNVLHYYYLKFKKNRIKLIETVIDQNIKRKKITFRNNIEFKAFIKPLPFYYRIIELGFYQEYLCD